MIKALRLTRMDPLGYSAMCSNDWAFDYRRFYPGDEDFQLINRIEVPEVGHNIVAVEAVMAWDDICFYPWIGTEKDHEHDFFGPGKFTPRIHIKVWKKHPRKDPICFDLGSLGLMDMDYITEKRDLETLVKFTEEWSTTLVLLVAQDWIKDGNLTDDLLAF